MSSPIMRTSFLDDATVKAPRNSSKPARARKGSFSSSILRKTLSSRGTDITLSSSSCSRRSALMALAAITPKMTAMSGSRKSASAMVVSMTATKSVLMVRIRRRKPHSITVNPTRRMTAESAATGIQET